MAVDVSQMMRGQETRAVGSVDARIMQRTVIIAGGALAIIVAIKIGFLQRVMP